MKRCKSSYRYKGIYKPKCNGGNGCDVCNEIYETRQRKVKFSNYEEMVFRNLKRSGY